MEDQCSDNMLASNGGRFDLCEVNDVFAFSRFHSKFSWLAAGAQIYSA